MAEFGDGLGFTDPDAEMDFDDLAELDDYLDDLEVTWFADQETLDALRKAIPAHRIYPGFIEQFIAWISDWRWRHMGSDCRSATARPEHVFQSRFGLAQFASDAH